MSELINGDLRGMLDRPEFKSSISMITLWAETHAQENDQPKPGFYVEKRGRDPGLIYHPARYPNDEDNTDHYYRVISPSSWGNVGALITGALRIVPTLADLKQFQELTASNPRPIRGIAAERTLGGQAIFFFRQWAEPDQQPWIFEGHDFEGLENARPNDAAGILNAAGLNCFIYGGVGIDRVYSRDQALFNEIL